MTIYVVIPAAIAALLSSCTMLASLEHFVPEESHEEDPTVRKRVDPSFAGNGFGLRLGGSARGVCIEIEDDRVTLSTSVFAWDQHMVGPILPVIPVLMGAGTYQPQLTVKIRLESAGEPLMLRAEQCLVRPVGAPSWIAPHQFGVGTVLKEANRAVEPGNAIRPAQDEAVWLVYAVDNRSMERFDLELRLRPECEPVRVRFAFERTVYLLFALPWR